MPVTLDAPFNSRINPMTGERIISEDVPGGREVRRTARILKSPASPVRNTTVDRRAPPPRLSFEGGKNKNKSQRKAKRSEKKHKTRKGKKGGKRFFPFHRSPSDSYLTSLILRNNDYLRTKNELIRKYGEKMWDSRLKKKVQQKSQDIESRRAMVQEPIPGSSPLTITEAERYGLSKVMRDSYAYDDNVHRQMQEAGLRNTPRWHRKQITDKEWRLLHPIEQQMYSRDFNNMWKYRDIGEGHRIGPHQPPTNLGSPVITQDAWEDMHASERKKFVYDTTVDKQMKEAGLRTTPRWHRKQITSAELQKMHPYEQNMYSRGRGNMFIYRDLGEGGRQFNPRM